jgi:fermentation-respiration switch protein FrsA (DUF1100 family)
MDPYSHIKAYTGPVLITHGEYDGLVHPDYSRKAQQIYADARLHIIDGADHVYTPEQDDIAMKYLRSFCCMQI